MCIIFNFLGEQVAGVYDARNVSNFYNVALMSFANAVFVLCAFEGHGGSPFAGGLVMVVDSDALGGFRETKVDGTVFHDEEIVDSFVGNVDC